MNNPKASGLVAVHIKPAKPTTETDAGWDPYEVWRTRVLEQRREPRPAEARGDVSAKPFLVRS